MRALASLGARLVPARCAHEDTRVSGLIRWLQNNRSRCAPGRRALRNATGPRSLRPRRHTGVRVDPMATEQPQPLRAGTSRAPERDRSLTLSLSSPEARNQSLDTRFAE